MYKTKHFFSLGYYFLFVISILIVLSFVSARQSSMSISGKKITKIVLDAGHGGKDPGAIGKKGKEKDIVLDVVLQAGKLIETYCPDVDVLYTRKTDDFVELYNRAKIANDAKADLFISVHCNANKKTEPSGTEVYVMGLDKSNQNLEVAKKENSSILLEENFEQKYDGIDPNSSEAYIVFNLFQHAFLEQSLQFATKTLSLFKKYVKLTDRGVRQAPFLVLWRTTMPSVLIETGFISNAEDEKFLISKAGRQQIAYAIYASFVDYKNVLENGNLETVDFKEISFKMEDKLPLAEEDTTEKIPDLNKIKEVTSQNSDSVFFKVQLFVDKQKLPLNDKRFKGLEKISFYIDGGMYKYITGEEDSFQKAAELQRNCKNIGFTDCFVVAFQNGKRIDISLARKLTEK